MTSESQRNDLITDAKTLMADADEIVKSMAGASGEKLADLGEKLRAKLRVAKEKIADAQYAVADKAKAAARATDDYVHDNPRQAVGAAAAVGFVLGLLVNRR